MYGQRQSTYRVFDVQSHALSEGGFVGADTVLLKVHKVKRDDSRSLARRA
jgi:hypothetical protein